MNITVTQGDLFGLLLLGMGLGLYIGALVLLVWLTHSIDEATRLPARLRRRAATASQPPDEPPTERITHPVHDLPRRVHDRSHR